MKTSGIFTIHQYEIPVKKLNEPIYLFPFGDIHRSAPLCHVEKWLEFCKWAHSKRDAYFLGMGDYDDLISSSERDILTGKVHDSTVKTLESMYMRYTERLAKEIKFMDGKLIGLLEGNHFARFSDGTTSTQRLCRILNTTYLGCSSFVRLSFHLPTQTSHTRTSIDIWAHHGLGAARLVGGSINRVQQMGEIAEADILLMGHDHKKSVAMVNRLRLSSGNGVVRLSHRKVLMARTGSFLRGYVPGEASYVTDKMLNPTDLGTVKIELTPKRDRTDGDDRFYIDVHASI